MKKIISFLIVLFLISGIYAQCNETQINVNTAHLEEIMKIKYLGGEGIIAGRVIEERPFSSLDELIKVSGIGNWTLDKIKQEGLACVETKNETEQNNETQKSKDIKEEILPQISEIGISEKKESITFNTINLNPKTIKSSNGEGKSEKSNNNYAIYGFTAFCILIAVLFLLKIRKRKFSEFK